MREKIYANYKIKRPYYFHVILLIFSILILLYILVSYTIYNKDVTSIFYIAIVFFLYSFEQKGKYIRITQSPIIYININEIIVNYRSSFKIIEKENFNRFEIKRKRTLKLYLKNEKYPIHINLYHLTYDKNDYLEKRLTEFINN